VPFLAGDSINEEMAELVFVVDHPDRLEVVRHPADRWGEAVELPSVGELELVVEVLQVTVAVPAGDGWRNRLDRLIEEVYVVLG
jgi:hypothetical protein